MNNHHDNSNNIKTNLNSILNKSFLILDQIHESYFPLLEKTIFLTNSSEKADKSKIAKIEFVILQRVKYVENSCNQLETCLSNLTDNANDNFYTNLSFRLKQLKSEQKRILSAFKEIKHKRVEKERVEREQEELLTRRFTTNNSHGDGIMQGNNNLGNENFVVDLRNDELAKEKTLSYKVLNKSTVLTLNKFRNQKPLVKRVRTRYLNFSTDFIGMVKMYFKYSCVDLIVLFGLFLVIFMVIFCIIVWKTSPVHAQS